MRDIAPISVPPRNDSGTLSGTWVKVARLVVGLKAHELADSIGVSPARLSRLENGRDPIPRDLERKIQRSL
jgi:transcriptional regulator with XRE-family HTH domain